MYPKTFEYFKPKTVSCAFELLDGDPSSTKVLAGGQSLIPAMKSRALAPRRVVDITGLGEISYIQREGNLLEIGALITISTLEKDRIVAFNSPILCEAASTISDPLVRNLGTVGGNLCRATPMNDLPAVMIALDAKMLLASSDITRQIDSDSFFTGPSETALNDDEILTGVEIPIKHRSGGAYRKVRKGSGGFTIAGVAVCMHLGEDDSISGCRIGLTSVGPKPLRAVKAERELINSTQVDWDLDKVSELTVGSSQPKSDKRASEDYRRKALGLLVRDAVEASYNAAHTQGAT